MKINAKSIKLTLSMIGVFVLLAICARITEHALPVAAPITEKPVIVLDAGHGGLDSGAVRNIMGGITNPELFLLQFQLHPDHCQEKE